MDITYGRRPKRAAGPIDPVKPFLNVPADLLIASDLFARWYGDLKVLNFVAQIGALPKQPLDRR